MTTKKAFLLHLGISSFVVGNVLALVFLFWYPAPYFTIVGALDVLKVLVFVDLILGPVLTLVLFRPGKWGLKFDMGMIFAMQFAALVYGVSVIYDERPYYNVFVIDRFEVLAKKDVDEAAIENKTFIKQGWGDPVLVVASLPDDLDERQRILEETLFQGKPDIHQRPEYWSEYSEAAGLIAAATTPVAELLAKQPDQSAAIEGVTRKYGQERDLVYLPVMAHTRALTLFLDAATLQPVAALDIDPWRNVSGKGHMAAN